MLDIVLPILDYDKVADWTRHERLAFEFAQ